MVSPWLCEACRKATDWLWPSMSSTATLNVLAESDVDVAGSNETPTLSECVPWTDLLLMATCSVILFPWITVLWEESHHLQSFPYVLFPSSVPWQSIRAGRGTPWNIETQPVLAHSDIAEDSAERSDSIWGCHWVWDMMWESPLICKSNSEPAIVYRH